MIHSKPLVLASILVALPSFVSAIEMPRSLRDAERLYANGRYAEASDKAKEFQKLYPEYEYRAAESKWNPENKYFYVYVKLKRRI